MDDRPVVLYSEAFKLYVVSEYEAGRWRGLEEVRRACGIGGKKTVARWLRQYGKAHLLRRVVRVERPEDRDERKVLVAENRRLKEVLANETAEKYLLKGYLQVACRQLGVAEEAFKKKADTMLSELPRR